MIASTALNSRVRSSRRCSMSVIARPVRQAERGRRRCCATTGAERKPRPRGIRPGRASWCPAPARGSGYRTVPGATAGWPSLVVVPGGSGGPACRSLLWSCRRRLVVVDQTLGLRLEDAQRPAGPARQLRELLGPEQQHDHEDDQDDLGGAEAAHVCLLGRRTSLTVRGDRPAAAAPRGRLPRLNRTSRRPGPTWPGRSTSAEPGRRLRAPSRRPSRAAPAAAARPRRRRACRTRRPPSGSSSALSTG